MITLHICQLLEDAGFGTIDTDIFWEEIPVNVRGVPKSGIWVVPRGAPLSRLNVTYQAFDIYSRHAHKIVSSRKLEDILDYLQAAYHEVCELPEVPPYSETRYYDCQIQPTSGIENVGADDQDKIIRVISAEIKYKKEDSQ